MSAKMQGFLAALLIGTVAIFWFRRSVAAESPANTRGVSSTSATASAPAVSPITPSNVAQAAKSPLQIFLESGGRVKDAASLTIQDTRPLTRFNSQTSARAAYTAPVRTDYTPSNRATTLN